MIETKAPHNGKSAARFPASYRKQVLEDFKICCISREASVIARKEVLNGRANFGIIGDGKEVAQVAMARAWKKGDFRSGYYRDQTLMLALGLMDLDLFFAQLYGDPYNDTFSRGRQMNCHFATEFFDRDGNIVDLKNRYNISADIAPTAGQVARGLGMAFASKKFRENPALCGNLSDQGNEVAFITIGDASTSEGVFWETVNAAGVTQAPLAISVWDDGFGISVPKKYQTVKESISAVLEGFRFENGSGIQIYTGKAWDYPGLCQLYGEKIAEMRTTHQPALFHIQEVTQQLGHSTSGDHRRYKTPERLEFEEKYDCNRRMEEWMIAEGLASEAEVEQIKKEAKKEANEAALRAYNRYHDKVSALGKELNALLQQAVEEHTGNFKLAGIYQKFQAKRDPLRKELAVVARRSLFALQGETGSVIAGLKRFIQSEMAEGDEIYSSDLTSHSPRSPLLVQPVPAKYSESSPLKDGFEVLNAFFDQKLEQMPELFFFGEDVGHIGDVNQGLRGMQQKYGIDRVFDTGIREWTIIGQAIGMAMRGLRPVAEIQYLDYLLYAISGLSDDLCTLRWRSNNMQAAPAIIRTRGHRLVGVWHSGSPMGMILGSLRGMHICVPRNMTQAAGMYNTLLQSDDPALVIEVLNGYRLKEKLPDNIKDYTVALGQPEILRSGADVTLITYGACVRVAEEACDLLSGMGISVELIDVQTLLPFDLSGVCVASLRKTNRVVFLDEDFQGGASAYMMQHVLEHQNGYRWLDAKPVSLYAKPHRPAYGEDGDYHSKPQVEDVVEAILAITAESGY